MAKSFFNNLKDGISEMAKEGQRMEEESQAKKAEKFEKAQEKEISSLETIKELDYIIGNDEEVLYVYSFFKDKMIVTDKKLIYMDLKIAKNKTFAVIPFNKITSYALQIPTGMSLKGKLQIFTGGDTPSILIESMFNDGMNEFCKILADHI